MSIENESPEEGVEPSEDEKKVEELVEEIATLKESLKNTVEETKTIREGRREAREKIEVLEEQLKEKKEDKPEGGDDVESTVEKVLAKRDASKAKINKEVAFEQFITDNKMFSEENDPTGLKRDALKKKIEMFNTSGLIDKKDFYSVVKDSANLLGYNDTSPKTTEEEGNYNPYSSTSESALTPTISKDTDLSTKELKLIEEKGWTKEKFLKLKGKNPDYFEDLL